MTDCLTSLKQVQRPIDNVRLSEMYLLHVCYDHMIGLSTQNHVI